MGTAPGLIPAANPEVRVARATQSREMDALHCILSSNCAALAYLASGTLGLGVNYAHNSTHR